MKETKKEEMGEFCTVCWEGIFEGEKFVKIKLESGGSFYAHLSCVERLPIYELKEGQPKKLLLSLRRE